MHSSLIQNPYAHFQYIRNMSAKSEKHLLKTVRRANNTNSIPYSAKKLPKMTKFRKP